MKEAIYIIYIKHIHVHIILKVDKKVCNDHSKLIDHYSQSVHYSYEMKIL